MRQILHIFFFLFGIVFAALPSQNNEYFRHYNNKHGLSHNTVYCSLQDSRGFMWFGTDNGLNRFDGAEFRIYRHNANDSTTVSNERIVSLFEDSKGRLWVCTISYTCYYDYKTDKFTPLYFPGSENAERFTHVIEDQKGNLWFLNRTTIVKTKIEDNGVSQPIFYEKEDIKARAAELTDKGTLIIGGTYDLWEYDENKDDFHRTPILSDSEKRNHDIISVVKTVPRRGILIGSDAAGLKFYNSSTGELETILDKVLTRDIEKYSDNIYHIATEEGVFVLDIATRAITRYQKSLTNDYTISDNAVYCITKDKEGGLWYGSYFGGIDYLPENYFPMRYYIAGKTHNGMKGNTVREIFPDNNGNLWLATEDNGINCLNLRTDRITNYSYDDGKGPLSSTNIHGVYVDGSKLWIGTYNVGIEVMDLDTKKIIKQYTRENTKENLPSDFVLCFEKLSDDEIMIGTSIGLAVYDKRTNSIRRWGTDINYLVRDILIDYKGEVWIASTNGIHRKNKNGDVIADYYHSESDITTICGDNTNSVFEDSRHRIWITTNEGFSMIDRETGKCQRITSADGLPSNVIYRIEEDKNNIFWISTANGLVRFNPENRSIKTFSYANGLPETQFNYSSSYSSADGTIYMGTIKGMISFNPKNIREDKYQPTIYFTRIKLQGDSSDELKDSANAGLREGKLVLPYENTSFSLSYVALSYTAPEALRYAYKLEGTDKEWTMTGNKEVAFANLSPGEYTFMVKSTNSSGIWQDNIATLRIVIKPPFWRTIYAYAIYLLSISFIVYFFFKRKQTALAEKHRLEKLLFESRKEKELFDAKMQFYTSVTHEIKTPLTLIKAPLEKIIDSGDGNEETKSNIRIIEKNTKRLLDLCMELLDFRKVESGGIKLNMENTDIIMWIKTILQSFYPTFEKERKKVKEIIPTARFEAEVDRNSFSKIIGNLLSNAIKYSDSYISIEIIEPNQNGESFSIIVRNDGDLIPEQFTDDIFNPFYRAKGAEKREGNGIGLSLSRTLSELHGGSISYSQEDGLNTFVLTLPLHKDKKKGINESVRNETSAIIPPNSEEITILIVEDQVDLRGFVANELKDKYRVLEASNGKEALNIIENSTVNIIVSDVMMPEMDGFELCDEIKNNVSTSHIPIILLTAQYNEQYRLKGLNTGADAYMEKPFSIELLKAQIGNLLKSRRQLGQMYIEKPQMAMDALSVSRVDNMFLKKFQDYLDTHISDENLSIEKLAEAMNLSETTLYRKVKSISGLSPKEFVRVTRLKRAIILMSEGETRINEIAYQVGFGSASYFSTCFQKQYGKSPTEYIKNKLPNGDVIHK